MTLFNAQQTKQLLAPINPRRVLSDPRGNSHVSQQDVLAHLNRVFGFGNFTIEVLSSELLFEECRNPDAEYKARRWDVGYRAQVRVTILHPDRGMPEVDPLICFYENVSCGDAQNQVRHDANDLALKSAVSLATKRACIALGDQFGLSLYNKGQREALVIDTIVKPDDWEGEKAPDKDVTTDVPQQVALGTDETVHGDHLTRGGDDAVTEEQEKVLADTLGAKKVEA